MFPLFPGLSFVISIHAPAKGATLLKCSSRSDGRDFNPRSREGSDHDKGRCEGNGDDFNPRSREGSDPATPPSWKIQRDFNPRSREGSDDPCPIWLYAGGHFNPRSREGSDHPWREKHFHPSISIHAPAKGATEYSAGKMCGDDISIHAPAKGATYCIIFFIKIQILLFVFLVKFMVFLYFIPIFSRSAAACLKEWN